MADLFSIGLLPTLYFIVIGISVISAFLLILPKTPLQYIPIHVAIMLFPPILAFLELLFNHGPIINGMFRMDSLSWLLSCFVLTVGVIVQKFSIHYMLGDNAYRKYFALLSLTTIANSFIWFSENIRLIALFWGLTIVGLIGLIRLRKEWQIARNVAALTGGMFLISWLLLVGAFIGLAEITGHWQLTSILEEDLTGGEETVITLCIVIAMLIPAAQVPFQRWLLNSVVTPTPVSAVMHAGIVNVGAMMLTRFGPLFDGWVVQLLLVMVASVSVLIGTGIMLVQVDYKRQLVGSTMAQMGFMLVQCALGAYVAAITHAILHGLFKATLFLESGFAIKQASTNHKQEVPSSLCKLMALTLGMLVGFGFWFTSPGAGYSIVSSLIVGWSFTLAFAQLFSIRNGKMGFVLSTIIMIASASLFIITHYGFQWLLEETYHADAPSSFSVFIILFVLIIGSLVGWYIANHTSSKVYRMMYLWLVKIGEPKTASIEKHPKYLSQLLSKGGDYR
ncbi:NADH dehydrogenase subunit 5 [Oceanobacillus piezotolerans]|uniref:Probable inorganic carbon transporter subunit DabB n=1 Tax=Oceanobacillus piezotolerans TaxID=2448030 RepID=A0A498DEN8_9BACI|nr:NADH dehydrogenase subunit 5 [Oceanobacillus piezotolerans]RLL45454.1 NADH dehydrogenase subunit 5 [Oceanobacillus piezotolerans]